MSFKFFSIMMIAYLLLSCSPSRETVEYTIIPHPVKISYGKGDYGLSPSSTISFTESLTQEAELLKEWLTTDFTMSPQLLPSQKKGAISLVLDESFLSDKPESYSIDAGWKGIEIKANSREGILHGVQSLRQIIRQDNNHFVVQRGTITDYPEYPWRAFMLDEARYFKGKETVLRLLDEMALLKMNRFHWHLTNDQGWRIEINKYPKLTEIGAFRDSSEINHFHSNVFDGKPHGGFYTQDEIREIVSFAAVRGITIVPEISMPGHASAAIAAYPWLGTSGKQIDVPTYFGVHTNLFNVADERVMEFFSDVMDELIALFPGDVIHIGGDEVKYEDWKASRAVQAYMREHGLNTTAELQVFFTNNIADMLEEKGRRMMGWNEIMGQHLHTYQAAEDTQVEVDLNKKAIVHFWKGDQQQMLEAIEKGYDMVNSFHEFTYLDYNYESIPLSKSYSFNPIPDGLTPEQAKHVLGFGCQMWGEFIPTVDSMNEKIFPRIAAYAEVGWASLENKDYDRFLKSLSPFLKRWEKT